MASMFKKELLIRPVSSVSVEAAVNYCVSWLDGFYDPSVPDTTYFADIYDPRGSHSRIIRVFHTECVRLYQMDPDQLVFNLIGDPNDPGFDDDYLDEADPTGTDFVLADDPLFQATQATIASNQVDFENSSEPENDAVNGITEDLVKSWVDDYAGELAAQPGGTGELVEALLARITTLEETLANLALEEDTAM